MIERRLTLAADLRAELPPNFLPAMLGSGSFCSSARDVNYLDRFVARV